MASAVSVNADRVLWWVGVVGVALLAGALVYAAGAWSLTRAERRLETHCEAVCAARESACRAVTVYGGVCHDGRVLSLLGW